MSMTQTRTRNGSFSRNTYNFCTPSSSVSHDMAFTADTLSGDLDVAGLSSGGDDAEEDDGEKEAVLAPSDQSLGLGQAGLSLVIEDAGARRRAAVADMGISHEVNKESGLTATGANEDEEDDDAYNAVDDIPDEDDEEMNDPLDVSRLFSQEEVPSDPINDVPMRSIEIEDGAEDYMNNDPPLLSDDFDLLSPTSLSKADFSSMFPDSGYEAECKSPEHEFDVQD